MNMEALQSWKALPVNDAEKLGDTRKDTIWEAN